jgi:hypothetical protein
MTARLYIGDALTVLKTLPNESVDLVTTSPPYLALRSYLPADHPDKDAEMGSEANPAEFLDALLDVTEQLARVLAPHGSICIELGDTYANVAPSGNAYGAAPSSMTAKIGNTQQWNGGEAVPTLAKLGSGWPLSKSLCMIPEAYRMALAYGVNPFNGRTCTRWRVRNVVRHFRPNPPVGALGDKWRPATSDWAVACLGGKRYFDLDAVRTDIIRAETGNCPERERDDALRGQVSRPGALSNPAGAPPLDWYTADDLQWAHGAGIVQPTHGYPGAHYATFSPALITKFIQCMAPTRVCLVCGKPSERITETLGYVNNAGRPANMDMNQQRKSPGVRQFNAPGDQSAHKLSTTLGWSDCGHNQWRPGVILDPFAGSGTTLAVAQGCGRDAVGIELYPHNADLIADRCGMFLEIV